MKWMAEHPVWTGVGLLFGFGFVVTYWEWVVAGAAVVGICYSLYRIALWFEVRRQLRVARARGLAWRAEYEHWFVQHGWNGIYR